MKQSAIIAFILVLFTSASSFAQNNVDRKKWLKEIQEYKHEFLIKELDLTKEQQEKFLPMYDEMDCKIRQVNDQARDYQRKVRHMKDKASELEYEKAAEAQFEVKAKEGEIEKSYFSKFKTVLTPKQLFRLKHAEWKFTKELMKQHSRMKSERK